MSLGCQSVSDRVADRICAGRGPGQCSQEADVYNDRRGDSHREGAGKVGECYSKESSEAGWARQSWGSVGSGNKAPSSKRQSEDGRAGGAATVGTALLKGLLGLHTQDACVYMLGRWLLARSLSSR